jgi:outer membrane lipoprotein-sorting protein
MTSRPAFPASATLTALAIFSLAVPAIAAPAPVATLGEVSEHLKAVHTMVARFSQVGKNGQTLTGTLSLARPGRIRFQYQPGVPLLVVADGRNLSMVDYQVRQVSSWPIRNAPLGVLLDPERDPSRFAKLLPSKDPDRLFVEARDARHPEYGTITLAFRRQADAPAGLLLEGWTVLDAQNSRTTVRLSGQRFNLPLPESTFRFNDPRVQRPGGRG